MPRFIRRSISIPKGATRPLFTAPHPPLLLTDFVVSPGDRTKITLRTQPTGGTVLLEFKADKTPSINLTTGLKVASNTSVHCHATENSRVTVLGLSQTDDS